MSTHRKIKLWKFFFSQGTEEDRNLCRIQGLQTEKSRDKIQQRSASQNAGKRIARAHTVSCAKKTDLVRKTARKRPLIWLSERTKVEDHGGRGWTAPAGTSVLPTGVGRKKEHWSPMRNW